MSSSNRIAPDHVRRSGWHRRSLAYSALVSGTFAACAGPSFAQTNFYAGKTVTIVVGATVGGGYDVYARAIAPFLTAHLPGNPKVIVQTMPGGGGYTSVRHLNAGAPQDGTVMSTFNAGVLTAAFANPEKGQADFSGVTWLGSLNRSFRFCYFWRGRGFDSWAELHGSKTATMGGIGVGSAAYNDITLLKNLTNANVRPILGYPGRSEVHLGIERGELDGECGSKEGIPENWFTENKIAAVVRMLEATSPEVPEGVPWVGEFLKTPEDFAVLRVLTAAMELGRPYVISNRVPADRIKILRDAFLAAAADKDFIEFATKRNLSLSTVTGPEAQQLLTSVFSTPKAIAERAKEIIK